MLALKIRIFHPRSPLINHLKNQNLHSQQCSVFVHHEKTCVHRMKANIQKQMFFQLMETLQN